MQHSNSRTTKQRVTSSTSNAFCHFAVPTCCANLNRVTSCRRSASWIRWRRITSTRWVGEPGSTLSAAAIPAWLDFWKSAKIQTTGNLLTFCVYGECSQTRSFQKWMTANRILTLLHLLLPRNIPEAEIETFSHPDPLFIPIINDSVQELMDDLSTL